MAISFNRLVMTACPMLLAVAPAAAQPMTPRNTVAPSAKTLSLSRESSGAPVTVLPPSEWRRVDTAVNRALDWLANQQRPDGSFPTITTGQPAVTSLCIMAFVSHGHLPGSGRFGKRLER